MGLPHFPSASDGSLQISALKTLSLDLDGTVTGQDLAWWWQLAQRQDLSQELALVALPVHRTRTRKRVTRPQRGATVEPRATRAATETKSRHGTVPGTLFRTEILRKP